MLLYGLFQAQKLLESAGADEAWIGLIYNHTAEQFTWPIYPFGIDDLFLNNLEEPYLECAGEDCADAETSPVKMKRDGTWVVADGEDTAGYVLCADDDPRLGDAAMEFFVLEFGTWKVVRVSSKDPGEEFMQQCKLDSIGILPGYMLANSSVLVEKVCYSYTLILLTE